MVDGWGKQRKLLVHFKWAQLLRICGMATGVGCLWADIVAAVVGYRRYDAATECEQMSGGCPHCQG
jgi:hypothetical protein